MPNTLRWTRRAARPALPSRPLPAMWPPSSKTAPRCRWAWANLPEAVLAALHGHRDLGLHSGAVGDGIAALAEAGVLTHARKSQDRGVGIGGILMGGESLRRWAHRNPAPAAARDTLHARPRGAGRQPQAGRHQFGGGSGPHGPDQLRGGGRRLRGRRGGRRGLSARRGTQPRRPAHHRPARHGQGGHAHRCAAGPAPSARRAAMPASSSPNTAWPTCAARRCRAA